MLLLPQLLLISVDRWGRCHLWALGKGHTNPKPAAGPELVFSASILTQRELPISRGNIRAESAQTTWASLCSGGVTQVLKRKRFEEVPP